RDHLGAAIVAVLPDLGDQQPRAAAVRVREARDVAPERLPLRVVVELSTVHSGDGPDLRLVPSPHALQRGGDLTDGGARASGLDREGGQVAVARLGGSGERAERLLDPTGIARRADASEPGDLRVAHGRVVYLAQVDRWLGRELELVHADDHVLATVDPGL